MRAGRLGTAIGAALLVVAIGGTPAADMKSGAAPKRPAGTTRPQARSGATATRVVAVTVQVRPATPTIPLPTFVPFAITSPNPTWGPTRVRFDLSNPTHVSMTLHDLTGQRVATLVDGPYAAGSYNVAWDGKDDRGRGLRAGMYFVKYRAGGFESSRKLVLRP